MTQNSTNTFECHRKCYHQKVYIDLNLMVTFFHYNVDSCVFVKGQRLIFDGGQQFNTSEVEHLKKFIKYIKDSKLPYDKRL